MFDYSQIKIPEDFKLFDVWKMFELAVIPNDAHAIQRAEMRKAFYAGFLECFKCMSDFSSGLDEDDACKLFEKLQNEGEAFMEQVIKGSRQ